MQKIFDLWDNRDKGSFNIDKDDIKDRVNIKDVISEYTELKNIGGEKYRGLCIFHNEKTPSLTVYEKTQSFFCFGCDIGGDVIKFIMVAEMLDFREALEFLEEFF